MQMSTWPSTCTPSEEPSSGTARPTSSMSPAPGKAANDPEQCDHLSVLLSVERDSDASAADARGTRQGPSLRTVSLDSREERWLLGTNHSRYFFSANGVQGSVQHF